MSDFDIYDPRGAHEPYNVHNPSNKSRQNQYYQNDSVPPSGAALGLPLWVIKYGVIGFFLFWFIGLVL